MNAENQPWSKAACAMPGPTAFEQDDPNVPGDLGSLSGQRVASSPYLSPLLEDATRTIASMIEDGRVQLPPRRCLGTVTLSVNGNDQKPPAATTVQSEAGVPSGTTLYFTPICVTDLNTNAPICALYCVNIHRVFMEGETGGMVDLSPTALEVLGGRAANRKWRVSLKVVRVTTEGDMVIYMGLGKWLDVMGLDTWLPEEAVSRVGSKQSSRNPTPAGSPSKRKRSMHSRVGPVAGLVEDFDVLLDVVTRPVRVVTSGQVIWGLCARPAATTGATAPNLAGQGAEDDLGHQRNLQRNLQSDRKAREGHLEEHPHRDDSDSDNGLIYLPSHVPSSGST